MMQPIPLDPKHNIIKGLHYSCLYSVISDTVEGQCLYQFARTQNFSNDEESKEQSDPPCMCFMILTT